MQERRLTKWLEAGYPHFKEYSGVPAWLLPERSFAIVVDKLGDTKVLESSRCLGLLPDTAEEIPDHETFSDEMWRQTCLDWPQLSLVSAIIMALLESVDRVMAKHYRGELTVEPQVVFRVLMVIAFAPFVPQGRAVLQNIATILDGDAANPARLITLYVNAVLNDDSVTATRISESIGRHREWACWADFLQQLALSFNGNYKLVAVTPPLSEGLADVLADMIKEAPNYGA
jgi:hypothetical protein